MAVPYENPRDPSHQSICQSIKKDFIVIGVFIFCTCSQVEGGMEKRERLGQAISKHKAQKKKCTLAGVKH